MDSIWNPPIAQLEYYLINKLIMETIEIGQNRKALIPMIILLAAGLIGVTYYIYFSGKFENDRTIKIVYVFLTVSLTYTIYIQIIKLIKDEPILILSNDSILINDKLKPVSIKWIEIKEWNIIKEDSTHYLNIRTSGKSKRINIAWLEKQPEELENLIKEYCNYQAIELIYEPKV